ncbi:hypothetical protein [Brucella intermedia]|uniref:hypothetical protein n=1 Tax=Brucella intermedia TaxID=94625 RepID=UPI001591EF23|nr:hypothetical protein [Brucella intermedia]
MFLAILAGIAAYFSTLLILLAVFIPLRENVLAFTIVRVPPYSTVSKWSILAVAWFTAYRVFIAVW